jgi:hypothetical protein
MGSEEYDRAIRSIEWAVGELNEVLGYSDSGFDSPKVTFGYIGNCDIDGRNDDRCWMVFLPHPGRVGTSDDRIGGFTTGSVEGAQSTADQAHGAADMAKFIVANGIMRNGMRVQFPGHTNHSRSALPPSRQLKNMQEGQR